jgi:hypothetical protein
MLILFCRFVIFKLFDLSLKFMGKCININFKRLKLVAIATRSLCSAATIKLDRELNYALCRERLICYTGHGSIVYFTVVRWSHATN